MVTQPWETQLGSRIALRLDAPPAGPAPVSYEPKSRIFQFSGRGGGADVFIPAPDTRPDDLDAAADDIVRRYRAKVSEQGG